MAVATETALQVCHTNMNITTFQHGESCLLSKYLKTNINSAFT